MREDLVVGFVVAPRFVGATLRPCLVGVEEEPGVLEGARVRVCVPATVAVDMPNGLKGKLGGKDTASIFLML